MDKVFKAAASKGLINDSQPSIDLFDLDYFEARIDQLKSAFSETFINHAAALKANSIRGVLSTARDKGLGAECASICEVVHALDLGFAASEIVFDSPVKTNVDLKRALDAGVYINLDNEREMARVDALLKAECKGSKSKLGLRINPVVGGGTIDIVSTATKLSKFGIPVTDDTRDKVIALYKEYPWLTGVHIHVGSQGVPLELFVKGARNCVDFVKAVESECARKLETIDIGGGLSTTYVDADEPDHFRYALYRQQLDEKVPELFSGDYKIITEFGRSLFLKAGKTLTRVEHVKKWLDFEGVKPIIQTHVGANQFIREVYIPQMWHHRIDLLDSEGNLKSSKEKTTYDIAGPLCFQGDYLAKDVALPEAEAGDVLLVHDIGAYTMAMYSKFNSIFPSPVYGFRRAEGDKIRFLCFKERETSEETLQFWGLNKPTEV